MKAGFVQVCTNFRMSIVWGWVGGGAEWVWWEEDETHYTVY